MCGGSFCYACAMHKDEAFLARFDAAAHTAAEQYDNWRFEDEGATSLTPDEAYAMAIADMRALLFEYV